MQRLASHPLWTLDESGKLSRSFVAFNFVSAMDFFRALSDLAEQLGHHPDIHLTSYRNVQVILIALIIALNVVLRDVDCLVYAFSSGNHRNRHRDDC